MNSKNILTAIALISALLLASACSRSISAVMTVEEDPLSGQYVIRESGKPVLQYNYRTVYEDGVVRPESQKGKKIEYSPVGGVYLDEYYKSNPAVRSDGKATSAIWAVPRSDYIHPLYGPDGEMLTADWPDGDHPHHRGVFWAWPEVEYGSQRGDIYALQRVFARPTGNITCAVDTAYAEIKAENSWMWEDREAIVSEQVSIRAYREAGGRRIIDLSIRMQALVDSLTVATRCTNSYGGLNVRMAKPQKQNIAYFTDTAGASPVRCWADFSGTFEGSQSTSGMTILQHAENPEYPGTWVSYPNLSWVQPTFPTPNTRCPLRMDKPLTLRYRLIVHRGEKPANAVFTELWNGFH
ncbi:MAG: PmoA family protein [Prevotellaceae bacterium]|jgi:hypothetical protein|nr:PmoA family protein [Prevotellaceae bacterium]